eukprot:SAG22_NODE_229_length_14598_cov_13.257052_11_plen_286_part_00
MWVLLMLSGLTNWATRWCVPSLVPFVAASMELNELQRAFLLSSFFPGYLVTQLPGGWAAQRFGARMVLTVNMCGTALCMLLLPLAIRGTKSVRAVGALLTTMGLFQGPLMPARAMLMRAWLPNGPRRAVGTRVIGLGATLSDSFTPGITVLLASWLGFDAVGWVLGGFTAAVCTAWQTLATDRPVELQAVSPAVGVALQDENESEGSGAGQATTKASGRRRNENAKKVAEWRIFTVPAVQAVMAAKVAWGVHWFVFQQWTPIYLMEVLGWWVMRHSIFAALRCLD